MLPNFVIAGATRSGTTSLYYYLKQHPEISFPDLKEPRYFSSVNLKLPQKGPGDNTVDEKLILNFKDYEKLYERIKNKVVGDASSEYLYHHQDSAKRIFNKLGDIPIILILRNPLERAFSAYSNLVRDGREKLSFEQAVLKEQERRQDNWDMMWSYIDVSLYSKQVATFMDTFSQVKVLIFEEFITDPNKYLKELFQFLDVDSTFKSETKTVYSHSGEPKNKFIGWLTSRQNKLIYPFRKLLLKIIPRKYLEIISKKIFEKNNHKLEVDKKTNQKINKDILILENLLKKNLEIWKN